jgi:predicted DNA-binding transcriptional regulator YafY
MRLCRVVYRQTKYQARHVHPQHIACVDNQWYLFAWDCKRREPKARLQ